MTKKVVLIIDNSVGITGALKSICQTASDLKEHYQFKMVVPVWSMATSWIRKYAVDSVMAMPLIEISTRIRPLILYVPFLLRNTVALRNLVVKENVSIIHVNDLYNLLPVTIRALGVRVPYVCHIRFMPDRFPPWLFNFWLKLHLRYADRIIAVSQSVQSLLPVHPKIIVIHDRIPDESTVRPVESVGSQKASSTFLYLSNFMAGKGQNLALKAFSTIHHHLPNWRIRFVGGDMNLEKNKRFRDNLMMEAKKMGIWEKTEWVEFTEDVEKEYNQADIVLNFSESESFSMTCAEALRFGRAVIATDSGGPEEIIEDNQSGIIVKNGDISEMAKAMTVLAMDKRLRDQFADYGKKSVMVKFNSNQTSGKVLEVYNSIVTA